MYPSLDMARNLINKNWKVRKNDHKTNRKFWHNKIERNIARDKIVNRTLKKAGWEVLRFWGQEIETDLKDCVKKIERVKQQNLRRAFA